jgi:hypothetical protein
MSTFEISQIVFPVIGYRNSEYLFLGNGFFLENPNTFITASHILNDKEIVCEKFYFMADGKLILLKSKPDFVDKNRVSENSPPTYKDLTIFKTENPFKKFLLSGNYQISRHSILHCFGTYDPIITRETPLPFVTNSLPDISRLIFEKFVLKVFNPVQADFKFENQTHIEGNLTYTNSFECNGGIERGISGSPILDTESGFQGMAVCSNQNRSIFLQSGYILFMLSHYK